MDEKFGKLGKDRVTGFTGIIVAKVEYLYGCNQYALRPPVDPDKMELKDAQYFDEGRIEIIGQGIRAEDVQAKEPGAEYNSECPR